MAKDKGKQGEKGKARDRKLTVKKEPVKDLDPKKGKDVKGGVYPADASFKTRF